MQEVNQPTGVIVTPTAEVTQEDLQNLKDQINLSFEEVANLIADCQRLIELLEERIQLFNVRSSHKI